MISWRRKTKIKNKVRSFLVRNSESFEVKRVGTFPRVLYKRSLRGSYPLGGLGSCRGTDARGAKDLQTHGGIPLCDVNPTSRQ